MNLWGFDVATLDLDGFFCDRPLDLFNRWMFILHGFTDVEKELGGS
jgi:hypothetical protein